MFEATGGDGKIQGGLRRLAIGQSVNQPGRERVATAHAIHNVADLVFPTEPELPSVVQAGGPAIDIGAVAFAQCDGVLKYFCVNVD